MSNTNNSSKTFETGKQVFALHTIIGTEVGRGSRLRIVESYSEPRAETRYLVRTEGGFKVYCYASDLSDRDPR